MTSPAIRVPRPRCLPAGSLLLRHLLLRHLSLRHLSLRHLSLRHLSLRHLSLGSLLLVIAALLCALPGTARADEPTIDEVRYHPTELPPDGTRSRLLLTGAGVAVGWYGVAVGTSYLYPNAPNAKDLRLPVVGPWMALDDVRCGSKERNCRDAVLVIRTAFAVLSGVGQAGGLLGVLEGLFLPGPAAAPGADIRPSAARRSSPLADSGAAQRSSAKSSWAAVPVVLPDGAAIELVGRF